MEIDFENINEKVRDKYFNSGDMSFSSFWNVLFTRSQNQCESEKQELGFEYQAARYARQLFLTKTVCQPNFSYNKHYENNRLML